MIQVSARRFVQYWRVLVFILAGITPVAAWAHASLLRAEPADGAVLDVAPAQVTLVFNEAVSPLALRLAGPDGRVVALGPIDARDETVSARLPSGLGRGTHLVSWRVISADGHPVGGTVVFSVGQAGERPRDPAAQSAPGLRPAIWLAALALLAGLLFGVGGLAFDAWRGRVGDGWRVHIAWMLLVLVAAPLSLGLQGVDALDVPLAALGSVATWRTALGTSYGMLVGLAMLAAFCGLLATAALRPARQRAGAGLALLLLGAALAASGHAATAQPAGLSRIAVFAHVLMAACWLGALARLPAALRREDGATALRRFSAVAAGLLALLALSGVALAYWQMGRVADLWQTRYGQVLSGKLVLVACLLAIAARNRWRWTQPALAGQPAAVGALSRNIRYEWVLALAILAVIGLWRFTPPPRALEARAAIGLHLQGAGIVADLQIAPRTGGQASITATIANAVYVPIQPQEVTILLSNAAAGVEPIARQAQRGADGSWVVAEVPLPVPGRWTVRLEALITDFDRTSLEGSVDIGTTTGVLAAPPGGMDMDMDHAHGAMGGAMHAAPAPVGAAPAH